MLVDRVLVIGFVLIGMSQSEPSTTTKAPPILPWLENLVELPMPKELEQYTGNETDVFTESFVPDHISQELLPFINETAVKHFRSRQNRTEDEIITDEDIAGDDDEGPEVNRPIFDGETTTIPLSTSAGIQLYQHWLDQAVSGLMAAVATNKLVNVPPSERQLHHKCTKGVKTVQEHAKCVSALLDAHEVHQENKKTRNNVVSGHKKHRKTRKGGKGSKKYEKTTVSPTSNNANTTSPVIVKKTEESSWIGSFRRAKRAMKEEKVVKKKLKPVQKASYSLLDDDSKAPFAVLAKKLTNAVRAFKNKEREVKSWQDTLEEIREEGMRLKKKDKAKKMMKKRLEMFTKAVKDVGVDPSGALETMGIDFYKDEPDMSERDELLQEARDLEKSMTKEDKILREPIKLIRQGVKLGMALTGQDVSDFENKTIRMVSPKLMALVPEEEDTAKDTVSLLSPSLLSLHNKPGPNEQFSLAQLLNVFEDEGQQEWMNFVFEASGVSDAVGYMKNLKEKEDRDELVGKMKEMGAEGPKTQGFTKDNITEMFGDWERSKIERMEELHRRFTPQQMSAMNSTGFVTMTQQQLDFVYGPESPYNDSRALDRLSNLTEDQVTKAIEHTIRMIAKEQVAFKVQREHDLILTPVVYTSFIGDPVGVSQSLILSPVFMSPLIYSPSIFGNVILSPWAFVPVIVSPRILGAVILSPILFAPVVLSPLVMVPLILSPGVGVPFVLSPFALCPFILSPVALTPLILSPFVLSPFILIPNVLSPMILSPFVLSPLILSPPAVSAFVLNPYALSPIIKSPGAAFTAVLSPSWLS